MDGYHCLNPFLLHQRVRLQDLQEIPELVKSGCFMATNDLDSRYWHLRVKPEHWTFIGIHIVNEDGSVSYFVWLVMHLGVSNAVFIFTTMLKPITSYLASKGIPTLIYIDDQLVVGKDEEECAAHNKFAVDTLGKAGWVVSPSKATGPASRLTFLGLDVCSITPKFYIPEKKFLNICSLLEEAFFARKLQPRQLARLVGKLQSCSLAVGPVVRLMTRELYQFICKVVEEYSWS